MNIIRYPGGKTHVRKQILSEIPLCAELREPFAGGAAVGLEALRQGICQSLWLNDIDQDMASIFQCIIDDPDRLNALLLTLTPNPETFVRFRTALKVPPVKSELNAFERAAMKIAVQRWSWGSTGVRGGAMGEIAARFKMNKLPAVISETHKLLAGRCVVTSLDFMDVLTAPGEDVFIYADPPYVAKGPGLYLHYFGDADHRRLHAALESCQHDWLLSYDDHKLVHELYQGFASGQLRVRGNRNFNTELLISSRRC